MILYFSGTGNSRFAAEYLSKLLQDDAVDAGKRIQAGDTGPLFSHRPWIFVAPVYAWQMAHLLEDHIRKTELSGCRDAYFVLTCGSDIGSAWKYAAALCAEKGLVYKGTVPVVMPENYIAMFAAPDAETARRIVARSLPILQDAGEQIRCGLPFAAHKTGILDHLKSGPVNKGFYQFYVKADPFYTTDLCCGCGNCVTVCPLNNVQLNRGSPVWGKACTHCMACICSCPTKAIEYGKKSQGKHRYQCPDIEIEP